MRYFFVAIGMVACFAWSCLLFVKIGYLLFGHYPPVAIGAMMLGWFMVIVISIGCWHIVVSKGEDKK